MFLSQNDLGRADDFQYQTRRCLHGWQFPHVDLDPFRLGCDQCTDSDTLFFLNSGRSVVIHVLARYIDPCHYNNLTRLGELATNWGHDCHSSCSYLVRAQTVASNESSMACVIAVLVTCYQSTRIDWQVLQRRKSPNSTRRTCSQQSCFWGASQTQSLNKPRLAFSTLNQIVR